MIEHSDVKASAMLKGKVAIVTGASSGIGRALAEKLATRGAFLVLHGRRVERLRELAERFPNVNYVAGDICQADAPNGLLELALEKFGRVDFALNNAGVNHTGSIQDVDIDKICEMARINVEASYRFSYTMLKYFLPRNSGHLVHTTSVMGSKTPENYGAYAGTKHAIEALSEALRLEVAQTKVKISCVAPGLVATELHRQFAAHPSQTLKIARPLQAEDVAGTILFVITQPEHISIPKILVLPQDHRI